MPYFDGGLHGYDGPAGYVPPKPNTRIYCDACGEAGIPLPPETAENRGRRHWGTGFKWAPRYGAPCHTCGRHC